MSELVLVKCDFCEGFGVYATRKVYARWHLIIGDVIALGIKNSWSTATINLNIDVMLEGFRKGENVCPVCGGTMVIPK